MAEDESYTFPRAGLGIKAIDEIIRKYMQERRQKENDPLSSQRDQDSSESSSKGSRSILSARQDKVQSYEAYFIDGKSLLFSFFCCQGIGFLLLVSSSFIVHVIFQCTITKPVLDKMTR